MILDQTAWAIAKLPAISSSGYMEIVLRTVTKQEAKDLRVQLFKKLAVRREYVVIPLKGKKAIR